MKELAPASSLDSDTDAEGENRIDTIITSMTEIGRIIIAQGTESTYESASGKLDEHRKSLDIPLTDDTHLSATIAFPTNERMISSARITIRVTGPAPEHYVSAQTTRKSVTLFGKPRWEPNHSLGVAVNKYFYPEAKNFEKPNPPKTGYHKTEEKYFPKTFYTNKDGVDSVHIHSPIARHGEATLAFVATFVSESLAILREYDQSHPTEEMQTKELPETIL